MTMCFQLEDESTERTEQNGIYSQKKCRKMRKIEWLTDWTVSLVSLGIKASEHKSTRHLQQSANHRHFQLPGIKCFPFLFPFLLCHFTTILFAISPICSIRENKWCSTRRCEERPAEQRPAVVSLHFRFIRGYVVFARSRTQQTCHSPYKHMRRFTATLMNPGCWGFPRTWNVFFPDPEYNLVAWLFHFAIPLRYLESRSLSHKARCHNNCADGRKGQ